MKNGDGEVKVQVVYATKSGCTQGIAERIGKDLEGHGAAVEVDRIDDLKEALDKLTSHPEKLVKMREIIQSIKKPLACYDVAKLALEMSAK